jgi:hypothetical protein
MFKENQQKNKNNAEFSAQQELQVPNGFECPITGEIMQNPVMAADGHTYEHAAIVQWINLGKSTSPLTNNRFPNFILIPNHNLKKAIGSWQEQTPIVQKIIQKYADYELAARFHLEEKEALIHESNLISHIAVSPSNAPGFMPHYQSAQQRETKETLDFVLLQTLQGLLETQKHAQKIVLERKALYDRKV